MKQSEYKKQLELEHQKRLSYVSPPQTYTIIRCKNQKPSMCCWGCEKCGRSGCNNGIFLSLRKDIDKVIYVDCDLEEG